jgi:hypothetical protein
LSVNAHALCEMLFPAEVLATVRSPCIKSILRQVLLLLLIPAIREPLWASGPM